MMGLQNVFKIAVINCNKLTSFLGEIHYYIRVWSSSSHSVSSYLNIVGYLRSCRYNRVVFLLYSNAKYKPRFEILYLVMLEFSCELSLVTFSKRTADVDNTLTS